VGDRVNSIADEKTPEKKKANEPPSPTRRQQDIKRDKSVAEFERQVEEGTVQIRQMTPAERKANPPQNRPRKGRQK
jgi:hypothetical protein